jgi:hypothetical protein
MWIPLAAEKRSECGGIFGIPVNDQVPLAEEHSGFAIRQSPRGVQHPRLVRIRRNSTNEYASCGKIDHEEDVVCDQAPPAPDLDCKEVTGGDHFPVRLQKHRPGHTSAAGWCWLDEMFF